MVSFARLPRVVISISLVLPACAALGHTGAYAGQVYSISNSLSGSSVQNGWTIAGTIELQDSTAFGAIAGSNIKNWNWTASKPGSSSLSANSLTGFTNLFTCPAGEITATATGLYYKSNTDVSLGFFDSSGNKQVSWGSNPDSPSFFGAYDYDISSPQLFGVSPPDCPHRRHVRLSIRSCRSRALHLRHGPRRSGLRRLLALPPSPLTLTGAGKSGTGANFACIRVGAA